jgi:hypothetical protein
MTGPQDPSKAEPVSCVYGRIHDPMVGITKMAEKAPVPHHDTVTG